MMAGNFCVGPSGIFSVLSKRDLPIKRNHHCFQLLEIHVRMFYYYCARIIRNRHHDQLIYSRFFLFLDETYIRAPSRYRFIYACRWMYESIEIIFILSDLILVCSGTENLYSTTPFLLELHYVALFQSLHSSK